MAVNYLQSLGGVQDYAPKEGSLVGSGKLVQRLIATLLDLDIGNHKHLHSHSYSHDHVSTHFLALTIAS